MTTIDELRRDARESLRAGDQRSALRSLLEADDLGPPDPWVLEYLARIHRRLALPDRALVYLRRALAIEPTDELRALESTLEADLEHWHRNRARFELIAGRPRRALEAALLAASGHDVATWTVRVLADAAVASNDRELAREQVARARRLRPDDPKLIDIERRLGV